MLKQTLLVLGFALLVAVPAAGQGARQPQRGAIVAGPPNGADTLQYICRGAPVPAGWIVTDDIRDRERCGGENVATLNAYNVWVIRRHDNRPAGSTMDVCANNPTPAGWMLVDVFRSREVCGHPENPFIVNVKRIRRTG
jgi:hypothetical protein